MFIFVLTNTVLRLVLMQSLAKLKNVHLVVEMEIIVLIVNDVMGGGPKGNIGSLFLRKQSGVLRKQPVLPSVCFAES